jgi:hypothetical protein
MIMEKLPTFISKVTDIDNVTSFDLFQDQVEFVDNCLHFVDIQIDKMILDRKLDDEAYLKYYDSMISCISDLKEIANADFSNFIEFDDDEEKLFIKAIYDNDESAVDKGRIHFIKSSMLNRDFVKNFGDYTNIDIVFCYAEILGLPSPLSINFNNYNKFLNKALEYYVSIEIYENAAKAKRTLDKLEILTNFLK